MINAEPPPKKDPIARTVRLLEQRSLLAMVIFFLAFIAGFSILYNQMSEQREDGDGLRYAGRQGVLVQGISDQLLRFQLGETEEQQQAATVKLKALQAELEEGIAFLTSDVVPVQIANYYAKLWDPQTGQARIFINEALDILAGRKRGTLEVDDLLQKLDTGARNYQHHYANEVASMEMSIIAITAFQVILIILIYTSALRPMQSIVYNQMRKMNLFAKAVEQSGSMVLVTDPNGVVTYANKQTRKDSGYTEEDLIGQKTNILNSGLTPPRIYKSMWATLERGEAWEGELQNRRKDGTLYWVQTTISPIRDDTGKLEGYLSIEHDITLFKKTLEENEEVREQLLTAIEAVDDAFALFDKDERLLLWNSRCQMMFDGVQDLIRPGITFEELITEGAKRGQYGPLEALDPFIRRRVEAFRAATGEYELQLANGMWLLGSDRKTVDGGRVMLRVDITKLKAAEEALRLAKRQADAANQAKSAFLSSMSHELRTPLNAILGFAQMMQIMPKETLGKQQEKCVNHIIKGGKHLLDLINEVLDLAKIEAGKVEVSIEPVHLGELLKECVSFISANAQARGIQVFIPEIEDMPWHIRADHTRAKQVILNLLSNAVKYNRENGSITLSITSQGNGDMVRLTVADTGNGIPADKQGDVFKPFNRLGAETSDIEGTGIGLSITRQLIRLMGGEVSFESTPGEGTAFSLDFVVHAATTPTNASEQIAPPAVHDAVRLDLCGHVLCVEDNPANTTLLDMIFASLPGVDLKITNSAEEGLQALSQRRPDLLLMDINLPGMDGFDAVREVRDNPATHDIPVVAMTANAANNMVARGLAAGFNHVLIKPIVIPDLIKILESYLPGGMHETDSRASAAE